MNEEKKATSIYSNYILHHNISESNQIKFTTCKQLRNKTVLIRFQRKRKTNCFRVRKKTHNYQLQIMRIDIKIN